MARGAQRMETGSDWSQSFLLIGGRPAVPLTISNWTFSGKISLAELESTEIALTGDRLIVVTHTVTEDDLAQFENLPVGQQVQLLQVNLTGDDTEVLGPGMAELEIRRLTPRPVRTIIRQRIRNNEGY